MTLFIALLLIFGLNLSLWWIIPAVIIYAAHLLFHVAF